MKAGDTFLLPGYDDHLWLIISDPALNPDKILIVSFISWRRHYDQSCIMEQGEHPFVKHRTLVNYSSAMVTTDAKLEARKKERALKMKEPLSAELLERIRRCARGSNVPLDCIELLIEQELLE